MQNTTDGNTITSSLLGPGLGELANPRTWVGLAKSMSASRARSQAPNSGARPCGGLVGCAVAAGVFEESQRAVVPDEELLEE